MARSTPSLQPTMDSADSIPEQVWEGIDQVASTPWLFWLVLGIMGIAGTVALVHRSQISRIIEMLNLFSRAQADRPMLVLYFTVPLRSRTSIAQTVREAVHNCDQPWPNIITAASTMLVRQPCCAQGDGQEEVDQPGGIVPGD